MGTSSSTPKITINEDLLHTCAGHTKGINCLALCEDKLILASGADDCRICLWKEIQVENNDTENNINEISAENSKQNRWQFRCIHVLEGHEDYITALIFHKGILISSSADSTVRKWNTDTGNCELIIKHHEAMIRKMICVFDYIITASNDRTAICSDFKTGELLNCFKGHTRLVNAVTYYGTNQVQESSDEKLIIGNTHHQLERIYTGSADRTAKAWSMKSSKCLINFEGHTQPITGIEVIKMGTILLTCSIDNTIRSWLTESGEQQYVFIGHTGTIVSMQVSEKTLFTSSSDLTARSWLIETGKLVRTFSKHHRTVNAICIHDGYGSSDGRVRIFDEITGNLCKKYTIPYKECCSTIKLWNEYIFTATNDGNLYVWKYPYYKNS